MTKRIISLILSLVLLFSMTIPAFASGDLSEIDQAVEESGETAHKKVVLEPENDGPDIKNQEKEKDDVDNSKNDEIAVREPKSDNADEWNLEEGEEESAAQSEDSAVKLDTPKITALVNTPEGVKISWGAVSGAQKYRVFSKVESGAWTKLADTAATSYIWTGAQDGVTYAFSVRCLASDGESYASDFNAVGVRITYVSDASEEEQTEVDAPEDGDPETGDSEDGDPEDSEPEVDTPENDEPDSGMLVDDESVIGVPETDEPEIGVSKDGEIEDSETEAGEPEADETEDGETVVGVPDAGEAVAEGTVATLENGIALLLFEISNVPKITKLTNTPEGVNIAWDAINGAAKYRVYRLNDAGGWTKIGDTTKTDYTWTGATAGSFYVFTVRCITSDGSAFTSDYDRAGKGITYTPTALEGIPGLSQDMIQNVPEGIKLSWEPVVGAQKYRVFYKTTGTSWKRIGETTDTSYVWTGPTVGQPYVFTVRCMNSAGTAYTSDYNHDGVGITYQTSMLKTPGSITVTNLSEGVKISWGEVEGAAKYRLYYKNNSVTGWTKIVDTTSTSYTWNKATKDEEYFFTVKCISADGTKATSDYERPGTYHKYSPAMLPTPLLTSATSVTNGILVSWEAVPEAKQYQIFYKGGNVKSWTKLKATTSTSYTWTGAKSGTQYTFTVCCLSSDGKSYTSGYNGSGVSVTYKAAQLATPMLTSLANTSEGVAISWAPVAGATKYRVYSKVVGSGGWTKIGETTGVGYLWTGAQEDVRYSFTVRCLASDSSFASGYDAVGMSIIFKPGDSEKLETPKPSVSNAKDGVQIYWDAVTGAEKYRVFYKDDAHTSWTRLADTTATSYIWTGVQEGKAYTFTVRCVTADGKTYTSDYNGTGASIEHQPKPINPPTHNETSGPKGITITWNAVPGVQMYRVYYKLAAGGSWVKILDTPDTSYTWTDALSGIEYNFTVRCLATDGTLADGSYITGPTIKFTPGDLDAPDVNVTRDDLANNPTHVKISWEAVSGAQKYRVYYRLEGSSWTKIVDTTNTEFIWTEAEANQKYYFTVRCLSADGNSFTSSYKSSELVSIEPLATPNISVLKDTDEGVLIQWNAVPGAFKYRILYNDSTNSESDVTNITSWKTLVETTDTSYLWTDASSDTIYYFTVCCISYDGKQITSDYPRVGKRLKTNQIGTPVLTSVYNVAGGVEINWEAVPRAQKYRVFYKIDGENKAFARIGETEDNSFTWTEAKPNTTYYFTVRCITADGSSYTSDYNRTGLSITTLDSTLAKTLAAGSFDQAGANSLLTLINAMRTGNDAWYWNEDDTSKTLRNVGRLAYSASLERVAKQRAAELAVRYGSNRPSGDPLSDLVIDGVSSDKEIIARGSSAQAVFEAWAATDGKYKDQTNRRILLDNQYISAGVASFTYNGTTYWVLELGRIK